MSRKKISTTIYVTPEQAERLRLLHERTKVPVAVYIREGIDLVLRQYDHLLPGQLPLASARGDGETPVPPSVGSGPPVSVSGIGGDGGGGGLDRARMPVENKPERAAAAERAAGAGKG
ncbi:MAG: ribbon-helix-helix domain-containing protein [Myxococcales bacterium]|nr:ribbon-helix-helix domain-containing protein [Myxococcales bacterium]